MSEWITNLTYKIENQAAKAGLVYRFACEYYRDIIEKEIDLANITDKDHILCIGGGICPFSAILFHQMTGAKVTVIDNNETCIPKARQAIKRLNISDDVQVLYQEGASTDIEFNNYSVIHLALQIQPMREVFATVKQRITPGTRLLVRRPKRQLDLMYDSFPNHLLAHCPYITHKARNIGRTFVYTQPSESRHTDESR